MTTINTERPQTENRSQSGNRSVELKNFINGEWVESTSGRYQEVPNPATGEVMAQVPISNAEDFDKAVVAAK